MTGSKHPIQSVSDRFPQNPKWQSDGEVAGKLFPASPAAAGQSEQIAASSSDSSPAIKQKHDVGNGGAQPGSDCSRVLRHTNATRIGILPGVLLHCPA